MAGRDCPPHRGGRVLLADDRPVSASGYSWGQTTARPGLPAGGIGGHCRAEFRGKAIDIREISQLLPQMLPWSPNAP
jgi:hypothetical protein